MKKILLLGTLAVSATYFYAQSSPKTSVSLNEAANSITLNDVTGVAVVTTDTSIQGLSGEQATPVWKISAKDIFSKSLLNQTDLTSINLNPAEVTVENVEGSPFSIITKGQSKNIVNTRTGELLFSSFQQGWAPVNHYIIPGTSKLLVEYVKDNRSYIGNVDLKTGKVLWSAETGDMGSLFGRLKDLAKRQVANKVSPVVDASGNIYGNFSGKLIKLDGNTGKILWQNDTKVSKLGLNKSGNYLIVISQSGGLGGLMSLKDDINIINTADGSPVWKEDKKVEKVVYVEDLGDQFLLASYNGTNLYDYATGTKQWKKSLKGDPRKMVKTSNGYIFVTKNEMNLIGSDGKELWKKEIEISDNKDDEIIELRERGGKVFYITTTYANIVDAATGTKLWKKNLKLNEKRPTFFSFNENGNEYVLYNDEKLYKYTSSTSDRPEEFAQLKLKNEKEVSALEIRPNGYLITGLGEIAFVDKNGKLVYQKYYDEPGATGRMLARMGAKSLGFLSAVGSAEYTDANGNSMGGVFFNESGRDTASQISDGLFALDSGMKTRYNATKNTENYKFYFTKKGDKKMLVKVNKDTGAEEGQFLFNNNKPVYTVDDYTKTLYYLNGNKVDVFKY